MADFKHLLIYNIWTVTMVTMAVLWPFTAHANSPVVQAAPAAAVQAETLGEPDPTGLVVIELFSSQACLFCPKADAFLNTLAAKNNVIALACHVDYFDIQGSSLAHRFCTDRQNEYARLLRTGPKYTPQMIINGKYDAIGYKQDNVNKLIRKAARHRISDIKMTALDDGRYRLSMPDISTGKYSVWVAITEKPIERSIIIGKNKGQSVLYDNIVSDLKQAASWNGEAKTLDLTAPLSASKAAISVWAQDETTGEIMAAGQFKAAAN